MAPARGGGPFEYVVDRIKPQTEAELPKVLLPNNEELRRLRRLLVTQHVVLSTYPIGISARRSHAKTRNVPITEILVILALPTTVSRLPTSARNSTYPDLLILQKTSIEVNKLRPRTPKVEVSVKKLLQDLLRLLRRPLA